VYQKPLSVPTGGVPTGVPNVRYTKVHQMYQNSLEWCVVYQSTNFRLSTNWMGISYRKQKKRN